MQLRGDPHDEGDALRGPVESVRVEIQTMLEQLLEDRDSVF
jgi:hypothetical protein